MGDVQWMHPGMPVILARIPPNARTILDVGCGRGVIGALCRIYREAERLVGLDVFGPYVEFCRRMRFYDECIEWDLKRLPLPFADKEFDVVTCIEVIEHLERGTGERLLGELERIGRRIVVSTPGVFFEQPEYDGNVYQRHRSSWTVRDFRRRGFRCEGVGDFQLLGVRMGYVSRLLAPVSWRLPWVSTLLLCVKEA